MKKIAVIVGTRPEAIKLAPIVLALKGDGRFNYRVCVTAQHRELLDQVLHAFDIRPDSDLNLMMANQSLHDLTARLISGLFEYFVKEGPDLVLAQGDTTTVLSCALAAYYVKVPLGHVEAGLRTNNLFSPWPEEGNRVLTSHLASLHFAPTQINKANLLKENIPDGRIFVTGNTVVDSLHMIQQRNRIAPPVIPGLNLDLRRLNESTRIVLITGHRRESFGEGFESICRAIVELARKFHDVHFFYPVHLNPNVREPVYRIIESQRLPNIHLSEPLPYLSFVYLMDRATLILTDSGGIQEEAPCLGKPVLVMRNGTERPEGLEAGNAILVGSDFKRITAEVSRLLTNHESYLAMTKKSNVFGDGKARFRILDACSDFLSGKIP